MSFSRETFTLNPEPDYTFKPQADITKEEMVEILQLLITSGVNIKIPSDLKAQVEELSKGARRHIS
ncbi:MULTISPECIES: hypothetical protein [unclassified Microcoleus]|uniref:hypothetical protein n=1 Tax=unclassified Microcoleus TaxID=2642155 RepID=UPI002FD1B063